MNHNILKIDLPNVYNWYNDRTKSLNLCRPKCNYPNICMAQIVCNRNDIALYTKGSTPRKDKVQCINEHVQLTVTLGDLIVHYHDELNVNNLY